MYTFRFFFIDFKLLSSHAGEGIAKQCQLYHFQTVILNMGFLVFMQFLWSLPFQFHYNPFRSLPEVEVKTFGLQGELVWNDFLG